jgi:leucyl-tRNA synthetase
LDRVYNLFFREEVKITKDINEISSSLNVAFNKFVHDATKNMDEYKHNLVISDMMVYINACYLEKNLYHDHIQGFLTVLSVFAPFLAEELNEIILHNNCSITKTQ